MKLTGNWQIAHLSECARFILYAESYLEASRSVCLRMRDDEAANTWPNGAVAMMLAAHSVELFLKGAIVNRDPEQLAKTHGISELSTTYNQLYPEAEFALEIPFQSEYPGFAETEIAALKKAEPAPSVLFRYPVNRPGIEWQGIHGFEPQGFLELLAEVKYAYTRIGAALRNGACK